MFRLKLLLVFGLLLSVTSFRASAQQPAFVTQSPIVGISGHTLFVFLPVSNIGAADADGVELTAVALTHMGSPAAKLIQPATLPMVTGSGFLGHGGTWTLDLEFDNSTLATGNTYLAKVSGTYKFGGKTLEFALSRPVVYSSTFPLTHEEVVDTLVAKLENLPGSRQEQSQALLQFINGLPQVSGATIDSESNIEGIFTDTGGPFVILNNESPPSSPVSNQAPMPRAVPENRLSPLTSLPARSNAPFSGPTELPGSDQVRLLFGLGAGFDNTVPEIASWLTGAGYQPIVQTDASVDALRNVGGDGVLYIQSHGNPAYIWTSTPLNAPQDDKLKSDIELHLVVESGITDDHWDPAVRKWIGASHWLVGTAFIAKYWAGFAANAFVFMNSCDTDTPTGAAIRAAIFAKHASVYAGWTAHVHSDIAANSARLVFDRLLGANAYCPENGAPCAPGPAEPPFFAQRPFEYPQIGPSRFVRSLLDLPQHHLGADPAESSRLQFETNNEGNFGLLAPSIETEVVDDESNPPQLNIAGLFGSEQGTVSVDGSDLADVAWTANQIQATLPPGLAGDVVVKVREHKSNAARITHWEGDFTSTTIGIGSLKQTIVFHISLRGDIRQWRPFIHKSPSEPPSPALAFPMMGSSATFQCKGTAMTESGNQTDTYTWSGSGTMKPFVPLPPPPNDFVMTAVVLSHTKMNMVLEAATVKSNSCMQNDHVVVLDPPDPPIVFDVESQNFLCSSGTPFNVLLNDQATILSGAPRVPASCTFPTNFAQRVLRWPNIPADPGTAPDPKSAR
jgi:hypothetical protein